ncbi:hypothetical protein AX14_002671 [Amanita brunnescens Koide BX004]|nr:hypothetical protein AX14_002671 [Amanita brunnescens Koide BX004]
MPVYGPKLITVFTPEPLPPLYATDNGLDRDITVNEADPDYVRQIWLVQPVEGKRDVHNIMVYPLSPRESGFSRDPNWGKNDVINSRLPGEWRIVPVGGSDIFEIHPVNEIIGVIELLGTEGRKVVIKVFPIGESPEKHQWRFIPAPGA